MSDPSALSNLVDSNPQLRQMVDSNPQMQEMMNNPELLSQMMSPDAIQASLGMMGGAAAPGSAPVTGTDAPSATAPASSPPASTAPASSTPAPATGAAGTPPASSAPTGMPAGMPPGMPDLSALGGMGGQDIGAMIEQMGGMEQIQRMAESMGMGGMGGMPGMPGMPPAPGAAGVTGASVASPSPAASTSTKTDEELKTQWASELQQMRDMGFVDDSTNLDMLKQTSGNVQVAIERLLGMMGS